MKSDTSTTRKRLYSYHIKTLNGDTLNLISNNIKEEFEDKLDTFLKVYLNIYFVPPNFYWLISRERLDSDNPITRYDNDINR